MEDSSDSDINWGNFQILPIIECTDISHNLRWGTLTDYVRNIPLFMNGDSYSIEKYSNLLSELMDEYPSSVSGVKRKYSEAFPNS